MQMKEKDCTRTAEHVSANLYQEHSSDGGATCDIRLAFGGKAVVVSHPDHLMEAARELVGRMAWLSGFLPEPYAFELIDGGQALASAWRVTAHDEKTNQPTGWGRYVVHFHECRRMMVPDAMVQAVQTAREAARDRQRDHS